MARVVYGLNINWSSYACLSLKVLSCFLDFGIDSEDIGLLREAVNIMRLVYDVRRNDINDDENAVNDSYFQHLQQQEDQENYHQNHRLLASAVNRAGLNHHQQGLYRLLKSCDWVDHPSTQIPDPPNATGFVNAQGRLSSSGERVRTALGGGSGIRELATVVERRRLMLRTSRANRIVTKDGFSRQRRQHQQQQAGDLVDEVDIHLGPAYVDPPIHSTGTCADLGGLMCFISG